MLAFKYRFHGHGSLKYVYKNGNGVRTRCFGIKSTRNPRRQAPRVAVVVSKKVLKSAVGRNRIRRRMYELVRDELPHLHPNTDLVIIIFAREVHDMPSDELTTQLRELLTKAGLYSNQ